MTLFEKLKDIIGLGWEVKLSSFAFQFEITVERETVDGNRYIKKSSLPLSDHFYEARIIDCINWSITEIDKDIEAIEKSQQINTEPPNLPHLNHDSTIGSQD